LRLRREEREVLGGRVEGALGVLAAVEGAGLAVADEEVGRVAARTLLRHRTRLEVPVAHRIVRAAVERAEPAAADEDLALVALRAADARRDDGFRRAVAAGRVVRAGLVLAEAAVPEDEVVAAGGTLLSRRAIGLRL